VTYSKMVLGHVRVLLPLCYSLALTSVLLHLLLGPLGGVDVQVRSEDSLVAARCCTYSQVTSSDTKNQWLYPVVGPAFTMSFVHVLITKASLKQVFCTYDVVIHVILKLRQACIL